MNYVLPMLYVRFSFPKMYVYVLYLTNKYWSHKILVSYRGYRLLGQCLRKYLHFNLIVYYTQLRKMMKGRQDTDRMQLWAISASSNILCDSCIMKSGHTCY